MSLQPLVIEWLRKRRAEILWEEGMYMYVFRDRAPQRDTVLAPQICCWVFLDHCVAGLLLNCSHPGPVIVTKPFVLPGQMDVTKLIQTQSSVHFFDRTRNAYDMKLGSFEVEFRGGSF